MARPVGRRVAAWWSRKPVTDRFRLYTRATLQVSLVAVAVSLASSVTVNGSGPWPVAGILVSGVVAAIALEAQQEVATGPAPRLGTRWLWSAVFVLAGVWVACAVALSTGASGRPQLAICLIFAAMGAMIALIPFLRRPWATAIVIGLVTGALVGQSLPTRLSSAVWVALVSVFVLATVQLTRWSLRMVEDLERARHAEAQLQVAQERLAFSRDLHDVVGRAFTTIALKSELAAKLARQHQAERAGAEMDEVNDLAISSMAEMRTLVRGYRTPELASEVAGARSLLAAAGCTLDVQGDHTAVPPAFHEVAAWIVREGTTNIVRHTSATTAGLTLGRSGMALRNDGSSGEPGEQSGLRGLRERLAAVGGELEVSSTGDTFTLQARWRP